MFKHKKSKQKAQVRPDKSYGQNFLVDKNVLEKIIAAADLITTDVVLEIGAGTGVLTKELAKRVKKVITFEIDKKLLPILQENLKDFHNVEIYNESILNTNYHPPAGGLDARYKLVANIPYHITSAILEKFLSIKNKPQAIVLLVQKEVAERICAKPGKMSLLSAIVQYYGDPKIVALVSAQSFRPAPKVESAILKIEMDKTTNEIRKNLESSFLKIVKVGFSEKRKMLKKNLKSLMPKGGAEALIREIGLNGQERAEELNMKQWVKLAENIKDAQVK